MNFRDLGLGEKTLKGLEDLNFTTPTPIQEQTIPHLLAGDIDLMGLAQTGTGKTAAFGLPIIEKIDGSMKVPQALILCPTRELCMQITGDLNKFIKYHPDIKTVAVYGGASIGVQIRDIRRGVQIVVATPGRMIDIIERGEINFDSVKIAVLDEADEMLNMGFKESINLILSKTPKEKNTWLFTATMPHDIRFIAKKYMEKPLEVQVSVNTGNVNIEHEYYVVRSTNKYLALKRLVDFNPDIFGIIFCNTKMEAKDIADMLIKDGYNSDALHGDLTQQQRDVVMKRYREKSLQLLVATDVAARGIDVSNVTHVINYSLPDDLESYTHRSGRTARAGKTGVAMNLILSRDLHKIRALEKLVGKKFIKAEVPNGFDVCEKQLFSLIHRVHNVEVNEEMISPYLEKIYQEFADMNKEEVIKRFASLEFNRFLEYYQNAVDLNDLGQGRGETRHAERSGSGSRNPRFFMNIGSLDDMMRGDIVRLICDTSGINSASIGRIDLKGMFSFFELEPAVVSDVVEAFKRGPEVKGRRVRVEPASDGSGGGDSGGRERSGGYGRDRGSRSYGGGDRGRNDRGHERGSGERRERTRTTQPSYDRPPRKDSFFNREENKGSDRSKDSGNDNKTSRPRKNYDRPKNFFPYDI
jgi:ATP-dependent RNA helicase DeaD